MEHDTNLLIQYIVTGAILLTVAVVIVRKLVRLRRQGVKGGASCCGCALSDQCAQRKAKDDKKPDNCQTQKP